MEDSNKCEGVGKLKNPHLQIGYKTVLYRKIPNVSPGLIEVRKYIFGGLYSGGAYIRGAYIRRAFCVSVRVSRP